MFTYLIIFTINLKYEPRTRGSKGNFVKSFPFEIRISLFLPRSESKRFLFFGFLFFSGFFNTLPFLKQHFQLFRDIHKRVSGA
jgi:hypothetical protein